MKMNHSNRTKLSPPQETLNHLAQMNFIDNLAQKHPAPIPESGQRSGNAREIQLLALFRKCDDSKQLVVMAMVAAAAKLSEVTK
jgi:hypothetical protein